VTEMWQRIADCWHVKMACGAAITTVTFLLGDVTATPFIALWVLVVIDTFTRWAAIGKKNLDAQGLKGSIWSGIYMAVIDRKITSETMRCQFQSKAIAYLILLIGFNLLDKIVPDRILGQDVEGLPNTFISTWLAFVELQSIIENLIEMGMNGLTPLSAWVCRKRESMTESTVQTVQQITSDGVQAVKQMTSDGVQAVQGKPPV